jgi:hypothetical protein
MKHRAVVLLVAVVAALAVAGSALAFDCLRVSSSLQGLQQSAANGGNWLLFDMTNPVVVQADLSNFATTPLTLAQATCVSTAYQSSGLSPYFALGFGVAGAFAPVGGPGVLAHNNPNTQGQLGNLRGIDHLDASPIGAELFAAAAGCGVTFSGG